PYTLTTYELLGATPEQAEAQLQQVRDELSHQVLPADRFPLFDLRATRMPTGRVHLHISLDLLLADAFSFQLLIEQCAALYRQPEAALPVLRHTFRDYCLATARRRGSDPAYQASLTYWRERVRTMAGPPELPLAGDVEVTGTRRFVRRKAGLDRAQWRAFREQARAADVTPSMALCAAFGEVLREYARKDRLTLNLTLFNRLPILEDVDRIVGDFTSGILLEVDCSRTESFAERARRVQGQLFEDLEHLSVSSVQVLREAARTGRWDARAPMPYVFTSLVSDTGRSLRVPEGVRIVEFISQTPQVWLDYQVFELNDELYFSWDYVENLFPPGLLDSVFESYQGLLRRLASDGSAWQAPARQPLLPAQQARREAYNDTARPVSSERLEALFLRQAAARPQALAVLTREHTLTYAQLERRSSRLAAWLLSRGAQPGHLVAIVAEKGAEQVIAALAILRAGAAYLPLDPALPAERLHALLQEGQVRLVLTQSRLENSLSWPEGPTRFAVDSDECLGSSWSEPLCREDNALAYVIYTSGSTGRPKGVMIDHQGAVNTVLDMNERFGVGPRDRVLALSSLSFDLSVYDLFGMLAAGAAVVIPEPGTSRDPSRWLALMEQGGVTVWNSVPALMDMCVEYAEGAGQRLPDTLRLVLLSGDWIPVSLPDRIRARAPAADVVSLGGATEASIWSILYRVGEVDPSWKSIPYGRPMVNQRFYVLDTSLEPCPDWVTGQLYIGGIGLSLGYYRDEARTTERFIVHPRTGERLYATGDLGRFLPGGDIEFLGREDFQVKIQGYRIELGEIEAVLDAHPAVRGAVVNAVGKAGGARRLVAYVVPNAVPPTATPTAPSGPGEDEPYTPLGSITDEVGRLEFKLQQPGLRPDARADRSIALRRPEVDEALRRQYTDRRSHRDFQTEPLPLSRLSDLLSCLMQLSLEDAVLPKYRYASAGGLYPVQAYLHIKRGAVSELAAGTYYYHPKRHELVLLSEGVVMDRGLHMAVNRSIFDGCAFSLFLVAKMSAIAPLYGEYARDFSLLEAGYIAQLLMDSAPASSLGLCPVGGLNFEPLREAFQLDEQHVLMHSFLGGGVGVTKSLAAPPWSSTSSSLPDELRQYLAARLPAYMVPSSIVLMDALPLTANGKVDRAALRAPVAEPVAATRTPVASAAPGNLEQTLRAIVGEVLQLQEVDAHLNFFDLGGTSVQVVQVHRKLRERLQVDFPIAQMFRHTTVSTLAAYLRDEVVKAPAVAPVVVPAVTPVVTPVVAPQAVKAPAAPVLEVAAPQPAPPPVPSRRETPSRPGQQPIAIVGMSGRFPGARGLEEFWRNLSEGVESISFFSEQEVRRSVLEPSLLNNPHHVRAGAVLEDIELFDAEHFGLTPKQARLMDPQQRIFLECVWEAFEDAGYAPRGTGGRVGLYAGSIISNYLLFQMGSSSLGREGAVHDLQTLLGNDKDYLATHISYRLGLKGPSLSVQTACSTSLVAVHLACQALANHECEMALAGGVAVRLPHKAGYLYEQGGIMSPDGHCRAFDAEAQGTLFGNGAGVVVLKRLDDALAAGDCIRAVIRGSAVNNDGSLKMGYTAPSQEGQAAVISAALAAAEVAPSSIGYIETHGTGTPLGDQIELSALQQVFGSELDSPGVRPIGSVKTNIGHLETAAGIASLIKAVLSLQHQSIPPSLHIKKPNPHFQLTRSPFYVNTRLTPWKTGATPRRAGVSSFGIGGTNAHVVLEEAPEVKRGAQAPVRPLQVLALSARTAEGVRELAARYATHLEAHPEARLEEVCFTANTGRMHFAHRAALVTSSLGQLR
ncbi:MAG: amino acid adenylation domain-containing protein, partial [Cystobacter sp.]